jgi:ankyrin repeat protein
MECAGDPNCRNSKGSTALYCAAFMGHTDAVEVLIQHGAVLDAKKVPLLLFVVLVLLRW